MGFVAEFIQDKDKNLVDFQALYHPVPGGHSTFEPKKWCIDRERNAILISVPLIGRYGPDMPDKYALILGGTVIRVDFFENVEVTVPKKVTWKLAGLYHDSSLTLSKDEILALLREALEAYTLAWRRAPWLDHEHIEIEYRF